jgi:4-hydroxybenzoate polyprenyltransferase
MSGGATGQRLAARLPGEESLVGRLFWAARPRFWLYLGGPALVGVVYGLAAVTPAGWTGAAIGPAGALALVAYFIYPANLFLYGVNDVFDARIDRRNPKKGESGREHQFTGDRRLVAAAAGAGLLGLGLWPVLPPIGAVALVGFLVLGTAYSAPPVRFKTTPVLDAASNGLYLLPGVVGFAAITGGAPPWPAIAGGWAWTMAMHTFSAVPDIEPDRAAGIRTTATVLGHDRTLWACAAVWSVAAGLWWLLDPALGLLFGVYPVFVAALVTGDVAIDRAYWWFPVINGVAGALLTMGGLALILYG